MQISPLARLMFYFDLSDIGTIYIFHKILKNLVRRLIESLWTGRLIKNWKTVNHRELKGSKENGEWLESWSCTVAFTTCEAWGSVSSDYWSIYGDHHRLPVMQKQNTSCFHFLLCKSKNTSCFHLTQVPSLPTGLHSPCSACSQKTITLLLTTMFIRMTVAVINIVNASEGLIWNVLYRNDK